MGVWVVDLELIRIFNYSFILVFGDVLYDYFVVFFDLFVINFDVFQCIVMYMIQWCLKLNDFRNYVWNE